MYFNECIFFFHVFLVIGFVFLAAKLGKNYLIGLVVLQSVFANLFVVKQVSLFGFSVTCSDVFAIGGVLGLNLLQELHGRDEVKFAVRASFLGLVFFVVMSFMHLQYYPLSEDFSQNAFVLILSHAPRITIASIAVYFFVQQFDIFLFGLMQKMFNGKFLSFRIGASLVCTQALDTVLFSFFGLWGIVANIFDIIFVSFCLKCVIIFCSSFFTIFFKGRVSNVQV